MQKVVHAAVAGISLCLVAGSSQAELFDRGGGLIYDSVLNITWLQDANLAAGTEYDDGWSATDGRMSFENANAWAANLNYFDQIRGVTYSDWRLPQGFDLGAPGAPEGSPFSRPGCDWQYVGHDCGWNMAPMSSELVHLFYVDLANIGSYDTDGNLRPGVSGVDWGLVNSGPFVNLANYMYWSRIVNPFEPAQEWRHFKTYDGRMSWRLVEPPDLHAWAVRDGDIALAMAVSEPDTYAMMVAGIGLFGFFAAANRAKSRRNQ